MRQGPSVSVVIPAYNVGPMAAEAARSVLAQTRPPLEVIVVDDGSTDDTAAHLEPLLGSIRLARQGNGGVGSARNRGVALAKGDLVAFLDGDDVWHPRKLEVQLSAWGAVPGLGCLGTASYDLPGPVPDLARSGDDDWRIEPISWGDLVVKNRLMTSTILVDRATLLRAGAFDESLHGPEDHDLWIRIAEIAPVARLGLPLTGYRAVPDSLSRRPGPMEAGMRRVLEKLDERGAWEGPGRARLRRRAYSHLNVSSAYLFAEAGAPGAALLRLVASAAWHPAPLPGSEVRRPWLRPKMLARYLGQWALGRSRWPA